MIRLVPRILFFCVCVWNALVIRQKLHPLYSGGGTQQNNHHLADKQIKRNAFASKFEFWFILQPVSRDKLHPFPGPNTPVEAFLSGRVPSCRVDPPNLSSVLAWFCIITPLFLFWKVLNHKKILGNLCFHTYLFLREAVMKEEVALNGKYLFYQNMRAALAVVIDNSEMGTLKKHSSVFSFFFSRLFFFFFFNGPILPNVPLKMITKVPFLERIVSTNHDPRNTNMDKWSHFNFECGITYWKQSDSLPACLQQWHSTKTKTYSGEKHHILGIISQLKR